MAGIVSYGAHIPFYRLSRAEIARAWGAAAQPGERAVANYDEDSLTMAVSAAMDCTRGVDTRSIGGIYFASVSSPYIEKQSAATIAVAADVPPESFTADLSGSLRAASNAIRAALDAVRAGSASSVLVCAADMRPAYPNSDREMSHGDAAAAVLIGSSGAAAEIEGSYSLSDEILDVWRRDTDTYVRSWEDRFVQDMGYTRVMSDAIAATLKRYSLTAKDFSKAVLYAPTQRLIGSVAGKVGFDLKTQVQDTLYDAIGNSGCASVLISLAAALDEANPGDRLLLASYGNGCDVFVLKVTSAIETVRRSRRGIKRQLAAKHAVPGYQKYLLWRKMIEVQPPARPDPEKPSAVALWLDNKGGLAMYGSQCRSCGTKQYPIQRVCIKCGAKDTFDYYRFADKIGRLTTFCQDNLVYNLNPPTTVNVVDFPGGGRFVGDMTDCDPPEVKVDMPVEMTFRKINDAGGLYNYWWKCRPFRFQ